MNMQMSRIMAVLYNDHQQSSIALARRGGNSRSSVPLGGYKTDISRAVPELKALLVRSLDRHLDAVQ